MNSIYWRKSLFSSHGWYPTVVNAESITVLPSNVWEHIDLPFQSLYLNFSKYRELFCDKKVFEMKNSPSRLIYDIAPLYNSAQTSLKSSIHRVLYPILSLTHTVYFVYIIFLCWWIAANTTTAATSTITIAPTTTTTTHQFGKVDINASSLRKMLILYQVDLVTLHLNLH